MKKVLLRMVDGGKTCSSEILREMLVRPRDPAKGTNFEEMMVTVPLIKKLREDVREHGGNRFLLLEDSEHAEIMDRLKNPNARYSANSEELLDVITDVMGAEIYKVPSGTH